MEPIKDKYDIRKVTFLLNRHADIQVKESLICVVRKSQRVGIRTWGKIDFLVHHHDYKLIMVESL